ncbi:MAG TPA: cysteine desulfurase-like protein [Isosphaeraceae bacterium]|nr:cysteine desulfurase-like protein [Isosphaeraceae bacterium]
MSGASSFKFLSNTEKIRAQFPALERRHRGKAVVYFDGPGGTQVPRAVVEAMADYLYNHNANTHWAFATSQETDAAIDHARTALADFLNAAPAEIVFGPNMTSLTFHLARALGRGWGTGDEVVVTELDHHANIAPWQAIERERGVKVRMARMRPETGQLDLDHLAGLLNKRTKLLAIGAASNALGTINPVSQAAALAHSAGALVFVDAVHYAPHRLVDVRALGCDFLACSAYKFYGPHLGVLYGRKELLETLDVPKLQPAPNTAPERLETGTQNHEGIVGAAAAVDFLASLSEGPSRREKLEATFQALHERSNFYVEHLWSGISAIRGARLFGPPPTEPRTPTVSFTFAGISPADVCRKLAVAGIFASHGDFYATTAIERLGCAPDGLVRLGCTCYTTLGEIYELIATLGFIAAGRR